MSELRAQKDKTASLGEKVEMIDERIEEMSDKHAGDKSEEDERLGEIPELGQRVSELEK